MGRGSGAKERREGGAAKGLYVLVLICIALSWTTIAAAEKGPSAAAEPKRSYGSIDVIMYQTSWWPYCNRAREFLRGTGVSLTEYDVEKDLQKREEMTSKSGSRGVPVVDIEGIIIRGFHPEAYQDAIEKRRRE